MRLNDLWPVLPTRCAVTLYLPQIRLQSMYIPLEHQRQDIMLPI